METVDRTRDATRGAYSEFRETVLLQITCVDLMYLKIIKTFLYLHFQSHSVNGDLSLANQTKVPHFVHPVK